MTPIKREVVIGDCRLLLGDCLEIMPELGQFDAVVTDPPYGVGLTAKQHKWFHSDGDGYSTFDDTPENVEKTAVKAVEFAICISRCVVVTPGTTCMFLYPPPDDIGCVYNSSGTGSGKWGFKCSTPVLFYGKCPYLASGMGRRANSWNQPPSDFAEKSAHPCPKPIGMMNWLVSRASLRSDTVLDPFMGSGTTGVACVNLGRRFTGIEIDPDYFEIAVKRIRDAYAQPDMLIEAEKAPAPEQMAMEIDQ